MMNMSGLRRCMRLLALLASTVACAAGAADFRVRIAKAIVAPQDLRAPAMLDRGTVVTLAPGGMLVVDELSGCGQTLVFSGQQQLVLQVRDGTACPATDRFDSVRQRIDAGQTLAARVVLQFDGKADGDDPLAGLADPCLMLPWFSEEQGRNVSQCSSGYLLAGIECRGDYCDDKRLRCCPYRDGRVDPSTRAGTESYWISEEVGNGRRNRFETPDFIAGLRCHGSYCDNLLPITVATPLLRNTGQCSWTAWFSEERPGRASCSPGGFVSGLQCAGSYCDRLTLRCCQAAPR